MRSRLITLGAFAAFAALSANCQSTGTSAGAAAAAPTTVPASPLVQQRPATTPGAMPANQLPLPQNNQVPQRGQPEVAIRDQAVTQSDQVLLGQVRQSVQSLQTRLQAATGASTPLHFDVANGVVTVMGTVDNAAAKQQIESMIQKTPGVVSVLDQLRTTAEANSAITASAGNSTLTATNAASQSLTGGAMSPADQTLLLRVRQAVVPQIQVAGQPVPVNFTVQQGVVTVTGAVTSMAQKRQIAALIQQVPGVVQVSDRISLSGIPVGTQRPFQAVGAASIGGTNATLTPTGRTNQTSLPPGLLRRQDLPPGLDRRSTLPPGLGGTNANAQLEVR
jgi:osmotically-inducible protein OsmY